MLLGALAGGGVALAQGPWLRVAEVLVVGNAAVPAVLVQDQANVLGHSMLFLDVQAAAQQVAALPRIEQASVERLWPRQVRVTVAERQPWAVWSQAGKSYLVDGQGYLLAEGGAPGLWPIKGQDPMPLAEGGRVDPGTMRLAQRLVETVPARLGVPVQGFEYQQRAGLVVVTSRGRARFDTEDDFDYKLAVWEAILAQAARERLTVNHVDLRFGARPFLR
jgi:cell division septal protein FtsQ